MKSALKIAEYILASSHPEMGDILSNLKLQKLLYYAQGAFLALKDKPLFEEDIFNWDYGPVVPEVYHQYKHNGNNAIAVPVDFDFGVFSAEEIEVIDEVLQVFGQFSAWKLRDMTHQEKPWASTQRNTMIPKALIQAYFKESMLA
jgi:uncharacterized phage-associated protein